jgi:probable rRNA maturation factor
MLGFDSNEMVIVRKSVAGLSEASLARFIRRAAAAVALRGSVNVLLTTNNEMKSLNLRFRGKSTPTDVLSFPPLSRLPLDFAGDIAISAEMAAKNGRRLGHSAREEVNVLVLHGVMHLAGYDHENDKGAMARKEQRLRKSLRLPIGLIERSAKEESRTRISGRGNLRSAKAVQNPSRKSRPKPSRQQR